MKNSFYIGNALIGGGKILIQSMTNTPTYDVDRTLSQINLLSDAGADLVRVSIPDEKSAIAIKELVKSSPVPLIGDIHFGEKNALIAIENGIHKIRINPGNMSDNTIRSVVNKCIEYNVPMRIGVNKGSSNKKDPKELALLCLETAKKIEDIGWDKLVLAVKTSSVKETVIAYEELSRMTDYPLHIGLTEAGVGEPAELKSAIAIGSLLLKGIGDTIRVSLAGDPVKEIVFAKKILRAAGADNDHVEIIACPTCSRTCFPVEETALKLQDFTKNINKKLKIAVMGCVVNGIGEGKDADFGVAGGKDSSIIFEKGKKTACVSNTEILQYLLNLTEKYTNDQ